MDGFFLVHPIDHSRKRRRFARSCRSGNENDTRALSRDLVQLRWDAELFHRRDPVRDDPEHDGVGPALCEDIDAKPRLLRDRVREIYGACT